MSRRLTLLLLVLTLGLSAYIFLVERHTPGTEDRSEWADRLLPALDPAQVDSVALSVGTNYAFRVMATNNGWSYISPFTYPAEQDAVESLLRAMVHVQERSHLSANDVATQTNGLAAYGFDHPLATIRVWQGQKKTEVRLGAHTQLGGQLYAQIVGQPGLATVDDGFLHALPANANAWRDRTVLPLKSLQFNRIETRPVAQNGFELVRNPSTQVWKMARPLDTRADSRKIDSLLQQLALSRVVRFVTDDPQADLEPYGLQPPEREIALQQDTNDVYVLQVGRSPTNNTQLVYARLLQYSNVVLLSRAAVAPWLANFRDFCDKRLVIFNPDAVDRIQVHCDENFAVRKTGTNSWRIVEPYSAPASPALVYAMLANLAELNFVDFDNDVVSDFSPYGLAPPHRRYILQTVVTNAAGVVTNIPLAELDIGNRKGVFYLARRVPDNSVVTMVDNRRLPRAAYALRDPSIWGFSTNNIVSITVEQEGVTRKMVRIGPDKWKLPPGIHGVFSQDALEEAAERIGHLYAARWVAEGKDKLPYYGFGAIDHRVTLTVRTPTGLKNDTVRFGRQAPSGRVYATVVLPGPNKPVVFECPTPIEEYVRSSLSLYAQ